MAGPVESGQTDEDANGGRADNLVPLAPRFTPRDLSRTVEIGLAEVLDKVPTPGHDLTGDPLFQPIKPFRQQANSGKPKFPVAAWGAVAIFGILLGTGLSEYVPLNHSNHLSIPFSTTKKVPHPVANWPALPPKAPMASARIEAQPPLIADNLQLTGAPSSKPKPVSFAGAAGSESGASGVYGPHVPRALVALLAACYGSGPCNVDTLARADSIMADAFARADRSSLDVAALDGLHQRWGYLRDDSVDPPPITIANYANLAEDLDALAHPAPDNRIRRQPLGTHP